MSFMSPELQARSHSAMYLLGGGCTERCGFRQTRNPVTWLWYQTRKTRALTAMVAKTGGVAGLLASACRVRKEAWKVCKANPPAAPGAAR